MQSRYFKCPAAPYLLHPAKTIRVVKNIWRRIKTILFSRRPARPPHSKMSLSLEDRFAKIRSPNLQNQQQVKNLPAPANLAKKTDEKRILVVVRGFVGEEQAAEMVSIELITRVNIEYILQRKAKKKEGFHSPHLEGSQLLNQLQCRTIIKWVGQLSDDLNKSSFYPKETCTASSAVDARQGCSDQSNVHTALY